MAGLRFHWSLPREGRALCVVADDEGEARMEASSVSGGPEYLLVALTDLARGARAARAEFEAEPTVYRWIFDEVDRATVRVHVLRLPAWDALEDTGATLWVRRVPIAELAHAVLTGFDRAEQEWGAQEYAVRWGRPLPTRRMERVREALGSSA